MSQLCTEKIVNNPLFQSDTRTRQQPTKYFQDTFYPIKNNQTNKQRQVKTKESFKTVFTKKNIKTQLDNSFSTSFKSTEMSFGKCASGAAACS